MTDEVPPSWKQIMDDLGRSGVEAAVALPPDWQHWIVEISKQTSHQVHQARPRAELDARLALYFGERMQHALNVGIPALGELISSVIKLKDAVKDGTASLEKAAEAGNRLNQRILWLTVIATVLTGLSALPVIRWLLSCAPTLPPG